MTSVQARRALGTRPRVPAPRPGLPPHRPAAPGSPYDAGAALDHELGRLRRALGASRVSVWVHEATTGTATPYRQSVCPGAAVADDTLLRNPLTVSRSPFVSAVINGGRPVVVRADGRRAADKEAARYGIRSAHGEPLIRNGEVVGVLTIEPAAAASPAPLRQAVPGIALALTEAWRRRTERRRLDSAEVLLGLVERAHQADSIEDVLSVACRQLAELGEVERACVFLLEDGRLVPRMAGYADGRRDEAEWQQFRTAAAALPLAETVLRTGEPMAADRDSELLSGWWADTFSIASALAVPLGRAPDVAGVLILDSPRLRPFSEEVRRMASAAGAYLGGVLEQVSTSHARAASLATAEVVRRLLVDGAHATSVPEAAEVLARAVQGLVGTERSAAYKVDADGFIEDVRHVGWPDAHKEVIQQQVIGSPAADVKLWRHTVEERLPVFVEDAAASDLIDPRLTEALDLKSYVSIPLLAGDRLMGLVVTGSTTSTGAWSPEIREAVRRVTLEGALVVENAVLRAVEQMRLKQLADEAHHDPLTGLPNRRRFIEELERTVYDDAARSCAVLMIDLDRFKEINDSFGHSVGDDLLCLVGPRLEKALQPGDLLARMGGDEFAVLLPDADRPRAHEVAHRLGAALRDAFVLDGMPLHIDASIGIALCPDHGRDRSLLLARADTAMYAAKRDRHGFEVWAPDGTPDSRNRLETLEQLRSALDTEELVPYYQPKLDLRTGSVVGVEALVRWQHPRRGLLTPDVFLPLAEQAGLMRRLALRVLERSLSDLRSWRAAGHELSVAVNLSVSNLQDVALPEQVAMLLDSLDVPAPALTLEITEDVLMADAARSQQVLDGLRRLGVKLSIDDYGTGYSSLAYLRALPVHELKLDRSFVRNLTSDPRAAAIVRSTLQLSRDLGMTMVVEGVEDADALAALCAWNCDIAQGFHVARPMPAGQFLDWLTARSLPADLHR
ncbi:bifunctional diguanylate cyclase/phosphodiesterase [Geodermatophilus sp. URMC 64]